MKPDDCTICGEDRWAHDPETGMMPSDFTGCACSDKPICPTTGGPASQCGVTKRHVYHPEPIEVPA